MMHWLLLYCNDLIDEHIQFLSEYIAHIWKSLKIYLQKNYLQQNVKQRYYLWVYLSKYKQSAINKDLYTYCLQFQIILNHLITRKKLNKYIVCLWFLKELSEKRQAKIVRSADIKMMNLNIFNLKKVLKMIKQIYEKENSLSMLWRNTDSTENLKKLIIQ